MGFGVLRRLEWRSSAVTFGSCAILPHRPVTHAKPAAPRDEESRIDLAVLERAVAGRKVLDLRALKAVDLVQPYLFATEISEDAAVLDCREPHHYEAWHYPGAVRWDLNELVARFPDLGKARTYVLYCNFWGADGLHRRADAACGIRGVRIQRGDPGSDAP